MDPEVLKTVGQVAGIGGVALGVLLLVFRDVIRKNIFPTLSKQDAYNLLRLIVILVWAAALTGIFAWVYTSTSKGQSQNSNRPPPLPMAATKTFPPEEKIVYREFDSRNKKIKVEIKDIIINNSGDADDLITIKASLKVPELQQEDIVHSYGGDFEITDESGKKLPRPFVLGKGKNIVLDCSMTFTYSDRSASAFEKEGMRRLTIMFEGETRPKPSLEFCYKDFYSPGLDQFVAKECPANF